MQHHCPVLHLCLFNSFYKVFRFDFSVYFVPLRPLREIKIISFVFHAESAKSAKIYFPLCFTLALELSQTSLRQECAESFIHPLPPAGYSHLSQGEKVGDSVRAVVTNCPSEIGGEEGL